MFIVGLFVYCLFFTVIIFVRVICTGGISYNLTPSYPV